MPNVSLFSNPRISGPLDRRQFLKATAIGGGVVAAGGSALAEDKPRLIPDNSTGRVIANKRLSAKPLNYEPRLEKIIEGVTEDGVLMKLEDYLLQHDSSAAEKELLAFTGTLKDRIRNDFPVNPGGFGSLAFAMTKLARGDSEAGSRSIIDEDSLKQTFHTLLAKNSSLSQLKEDIAHVRYEQNTKDYLNARKDLNDLLAGRKIYYTPNPNFAVNAQ